MSAHGVLVVDKPRGPTSHDVVAAVRRVLGTRAVGHAGTLDPMASGVLVVLVGEATKLAGYLTLDEKEYRATVSFGRATDTLDAEGQTTEERPIGPGAVEPAALAGALAAEHARTEQVPPTFSAISVGGVRAHRRSRRGESLTLPPRTVSIGEVDLERFDDHSVTVRLRVSKGYYVRAFARDLGQRLGLPAHLSALERLASGPYRLEDAVRWPPEGIPRLMPLAEAAARALPVARLTPEGSERAALGKRLQAEHFEQVAVGVAAWLDREGRLIAIGRPEEPDGYRVVRGFRSQ